MNMRYKYTILDEEILIFDTKNDSYSTLKEYFKKYLTLKELESIEKYKLENDRIDRIISYTIPKIELGKLLNKNPIDITIVRKENERPYFKDYINYHYSVSHSGSFVAFVLSKDNVGIDIEQRQERKLKALEFVSSLDELNEAISFDDKYSLWTFKEAYAKLKGIGITRDLKNVNRDMVLNQTIFINHLVITIVKDKN